ncbi:MAG: FliA/WhiG family RNA polymerase sigma factor [bacterium]|nr:FliA/WhiG family RNA polymerase sigma factor [bacterium]
MNPQTENNQQLWQEYTSKRSAILRERLLLNYLPLVKVVAGRMKQTLPQAVQLADLEGAGVRGLIQSVEGFDPERGVKFESYASNRIRGSILDSLREYDWLPRSLRTKSKTLEKALQICEARLGGIPEDGDVAAELGMSLDEYHSLLEEVGSIQLISLDSEPAGVDNIGSFHDVIPDTSIEDPLQGLEDKELRQQVVAWLQELPEHMRRVMVLYYYEELTLKEIGAVLNLSESRICQIHSAAIHSLRTRFQEERVA